MSADGTKEECVAMALTSFEKIRNNRGRRRLGKNFTTAFVNAASLGSHAHFFSRSHTVSVCPEPCFAEKSVGRSLPGRA